MVSGTVSTFTWTPLSSLEITLPHAEVRKFTPQSLIVPTALSGAFLVPDEDEDEDEEPEDEDEPEDEPDELPEEELPEEPVSVTRKQSPRI